MIAALFVATGGCYFGLPDVDPWDEARDARTYPGPWAVVAHPPCARWGSYYWGGPTAKTRFKLGADGGCFASALASVRRWGGVLEHPKGSRAWARFGLAEPDSGGGWTTAGDFIGWTCCVEQGHYGHRARKATWLYAAGISTLPLLTWGPSAAETKLDMGGRRNRFVRPPSGISQEERTARREWLDAYARETGKLYCCAEQMSRRLRSATPLPFRDLLLSIARTATPPCTTQRTA